MEAEAADPGSCDVYWAPLRALSPHHTLLLDRIELSRRRGYLRDPDRDLFTLGAALLRIVAGARVGVAPQRLRVDRTCPRCGEPHGRPRVAAEDLEVSVSHSCHVAAVAVTDAGPVGVDVEAVRALEYATLVRAVCAREERDSVRHARDFYTYWTRKESVLKALGLGLYARMSELVVTAPTEPPRLLRYRGDEPMPTRMAEVSAGDGYVGAVTVLTAGPVTFRAHDAEQLVARCPKSTRPHADR